jgi:3-oxoacyl-(acyl-carrier-protein) synthase
MKKMKRVVATGMSCITPIGRTVQENWKNILAGKSALRFLEDQ